ncbi:MAG: dienelactone hydrolase family protein, partial [Candidatus Sumerlaeota bacterium]|nr:dienelactone hydrolase family protein [Candidatus Sumerlaeota bacterium]
NHPEQSARVQACVDLWGSAGPFLDRVGPGDPPMLIIHGTEDRLVPFAHATELRDKYAEAGLPCVFHALEGAGHAPWNKEFDPIRQWSTEFLAEHLTSASPAPARH